MGKRARRKHKNRGPQRIPPAYNRHHLCYQRRKWNKGTPCLLRNHWYMIVDLEINLHDRIHRLIRSVTVPSDETALVVFEKLGELAEMGVISPSDSAERRLKTIISLFQELDDKVARDMERQLRVISHREG